MNKKWAATVLTAAFTAACSVNAYAGSWQQNEAGYWWQEDNGTYPVNCWKWLDGNRDGVAECYYFDENGYMATNTVVEGQYTVNGDGKWIVNGVIQTQTAQSTKTDRPVAEYYKYFQDENIFFSEGREFSSKGAYTMIWISQNELIDRGDYYEITGQSLEAANQYDSPEEMPENFRNTLTVLPNGKYTGGVDDGGFWDFYIVYEGSLYVNKDAIILFYNGAPPDGITRYASVDEYLAENENFYRTYIMGFDENGYITRLYTINAG